MRVKSKILLVLILCMSLIFTGCIERETKQQKDKRLEREYVEEMINQDVKLNDRQIEILKKEDISPAYRTLTDLQKEAIIKIDLLLTYLEDKYDKEFIYERFNITKEKCFLVARALDDSYSREISANMLWEDGKYVYSDTYEMEVTLSDEFKELVIDYISKNKPDVPFEVVVHLNDVYDLEKARKDVMGNTDGGIDILMEDYFENEDEVVEFLNSFSEWIVSHRNEQAIFGVDLRVYPKGLIEEEEVCVFNYREYYIVEEQVCNYDSAIDSDGEITIGGPY